MNTMMLGGGEEHEESLMQPFSIDISPLQRILVNLMQQVNFTQLQIANLQRSHWHACDLDVRQC
jgi:hypothetical protein